MGLIYERDSNTNAQMAPGTSGSYGTIVANSNEGLPNTNYT